MASLKSPDKAMLIPWLYREAEFAKWLPANGSPRLRCQGYVAQWPPQAPLLFLTGGKGLGKTTLAVCVLKEAQQRYGVVGKFWPVVDLLDRYRRTFSETAVETADEIDEQMRKVPLLVLDDWGAHKGTEYAEERLYAIVDYRYREGCPLVVTTNVKPGELDSRVADRLAHAGVSTVVPFAGESRRPLGGES